MTKAGLHAATQSGVEVHNGSEADIPSRLHARVWAANTFWTICQRPLR